MKYNLLAFKYFIDVVETQGFTPAAKRNFVSQTAISKAIKNLENELQLNLIDRSTSHFQVTPAGINLYHYSIALLKHYDNFNEKVSKLDDSYQTLKIHYLRGFSHWALELSKKLRLINPQLQLELDTEKFSSSITKLAANDYDILVGFSTAVSKIKDIRIKKIGTANFGVLLHQSTFHNQTINKETVAKQSLFLQKWSATDGNDVQTKIQIILQKLQISYQKVIYLDSFDAALTNVYLNHGLALYPKELPLNIPYTDTLGYLPEIPALQYDVVAIYKEPAIGNILNKALSAS
ncbi:LysR family transcriptional regulator [Lactobacillus sp. ESL0684]|uniref:LysR family transcriptional regulator n=1 Tax=Lactobacillus sp. ESL0684 TaxID=2983213 RepID=UPI0023F726E2|nr:LysR family transcriptional regulator [Lactobacillus sp. ESL0684]WEV43020.1 LysR family transcriptional regulator [Lactobacillus sp. ESL0684]